LKFKVLAETFSCYSFSSFETLQRQRPGEPSFVCSVAGDYSIIATSEAPVTGFDEVEAGWRCLVIDDQMPFELTGIAASITTTLATADVSVLVMSGYKTDYFFVKSEYLEHAITCLREVGHNFPT
jgi:hypothetical protein